MKKLFALLLTLVMLVGVFAACGGSDSIIGTWEGEQDGVEGCLSVPGRRGMVKRPMKVTARFQDRNGEWYELEGEELLARCMMHETDHLDGTLYVDKMYREVFADEEEEEELEDEE